MRSLLMTVLLLLAAPVYTIAQRAAKPAVILGVLKGVPEGDTVTLVVWDQFLSTSRQRFTPQRTFSCIVRQGHFRFKIPDVRQASYFTLRYEPDRWKKPADALSLFLLSPGDSIHLQIASITPVMGRFYGDTVNRLVMLQIGDISFTGRNAAAYECQYALAQAKRAFQKKLDEKAATVQIPAARPDTNGMAVRYASFRTQHQTLLAERKEILQQYQSHLPDALYGQLQADIAGEYNAERLLALQYEFLGVMQMTGCTDSTARQLLLPVYEEEQKNLWTPVIAAAVLAESRLYLNFLVLKARMDQRLQPRYSDAAEYLFTLSENHLRDKAIALYFTDFSKSIKQLDNLLDQALKLVKDTMSIQLLDSIRKESGTGATTYNFSLPDSSGRMVKLSDFAGKVVFIDFWYTGCGACSGFYKGSLSKVEKFFQNNKDVVFLTVCIDREKQGWMKSVRGGLYTSSNEPNVINLYTNGEGIDHALIKHYSIIGYPYQLLIDRKGRIFRSTDLQRPADVLIPIINEALNGNR